jgi:hypothetical protein
VVSYEWRGPFGNAELSALHAAGGLAHVRRPGLAYVITASARMARDAGSTRIPIATLYALGAARTPKP